MYNSVLMRVIKNLKIILPIIGAILVLIAVVLEFKIEDENRIIISPSGVIAKLKKSAPKETPLPTPTLVPTIVPTATPTPITVEGMSQNYGPCAKVSVLMYHHIQDEEIAKKNGQTNLTVTPDSFRKHLQYLKDGNYNIITPEDLKNFFEGKNTLPSKAVMITIDDGYKDNFEVMYPILKEFGIKATVFTATGLLENTGYMNWDDLDQMKDFVYFGNHTWSHQSSLGTKEKLTNEISLASKQLSEHELDNLKIFAYPYGTPGKIAKEVLKDNGYEIAFTTTHGNILCKGKSLELPRVRVGNASLKSYGI